MKQLNEVKNCYDLTARAYAENFYDELSHKPLDRLILKRFAEENKSRGTIADLGCGCGHTSAFLRDAGVENIVGIDLSQEMIKQASKLNEKIDFEVGNILDLSFEDEKFGAALAFYAIVHFTFKEIEKAFAEVRRVLKPGGQFLFSFHAGNEHKDLKEFLNEKVNVTFYFFEVDEILDLLEKTGFKVTEAFIRYPYENVEYPSRRAYITAEK